MPIYIAALFTTARLRNQPRCPSRETDKENMVNIHDEVLFSHKVE
jgi:hypothetical protein